MNLHRWARSVDRRIEPSQTVGDSPDRLMSGTICSVADDNGGRTLVIWGGGGGSAAFLICIGI